MSVGKFVNGVLTPDPNGKIVWAPVSISDVKTALNEPNKNDLAALCVSDNINIWSRRKPIRNTSVSVLNETQFANAKYGFIFDQSSVDNVFTKIDKTNVSTIFSHTALVDYNRPYGGSNSPYRLSDFDGYNGYAKALFDVQTEAASYNYSDVNKWGYSYIADAYNIKNNTTQSVNVLVDSTNHLYPNAYQYHWFSYTQNEETRYIQIQFQNLFAFDTMLNQRTSPLKTDDLSLKEIGITSESATFENLAFGFIFNIRGTCFLYNTKLTLGNMITGATNSNTNLSNIYITNTSSGTTQVQLAMRTNNQINFFIYPWMFTTDSVTYSTTTYDGSIVTRYNLSGKTSVLASVSDGESIGVRLCLCQANINTPSYTSFFKQINSSSGDLYSCEFKYGQNMQSILYRKYSNSQLVNPSETYTIGTGIAEHGYYTTRSCTAYKTPGTKTNKYTFVITSIYKYIATFVCYLKYLRKNLNQYDLSASDPYYKIGNGHYRKYVAVAHTSSFTLSVSKVFRIKFIIQSGGTNDGIFYRDSQNNVFTSITSYTTPGSTTNAVYFINDGNGTPTLHITKTFSQYNNWSDYSGITGIVKNSDTTVTSTTSGATANALYLANTGRTISEIEMRNIDVTSFKESTLTIEMYCDGNLVNSFTRTFNQIFTIQG